MIRLKIGLMPKKKVPLTTNYKVYLAAVCNNYFENSSKEFKEKIYKIYKPFEGKKDLLTFSQLFCPSYEIEDNCIVFEDKVTWYINSSVYELILYFVQKLFNVKLLKIGREVFEITSLEVCNISDVKSKEIQNKSYPILLSRKESLYNKMLEYYFIDEREKII